MIISGGGWILSAYTRGLSNQPRRGASIRP
jgi:hypothetical protein